MIYEWTCGLVVPRIRKWLEDYWKLCFCSVLFYVWIWFSSLSGWPTRVVPSKVLHTHLYDYKFHQCLKRNAIVSQTNKTGQLEQLNSLQDLTSWGIKSTGFLKHIFRGVRVISFFFVCSYYGPVMPFSERVEDLSWFIKVIWWVSPTEYMFVEVGSTVKWFGAVWHLSIWRIDPPK